MESLHEGCLSDLLNILTRYGKISKTKQDINKSKEPKQNSNVYLGGSISNRTKNLVMTFPVLCDNSLPPSTASMINRANERNIVTMLQLLFSSISINGQDGAEILSRIHKNISIDSSMEDIINSIDNFTSQYESSQLKDYEVQKILREMVNELKIPQKSFPVESLSEKSLNDYKVLNINGRIVVKEALTDFSDDMIGYMDPKSRDRYHKDLQTIKTRNDIIDAADRKQRDAENDKFARDKFEYEKERNARNDEYTRTKGDQQIRKTDQDMAYQNLTRQLLDSDIKKSNEMAPTLMIINFNQLDTDGTIYSEKPFIAGVKSRLISVDSSDIIDRITVKNKTKINFLNFIRATTGEISFIKDFLLCINQAKLDAKNSIKKGPAAQMWKVLETRGAKNVRNKLRKSGNDASAITTLVINQETVNTIKKEYDFDIENVKNAKMIIETYNLLGIIIADESINVAKFLYSGNDVFEQQAYTYLERESNDNSYKKVINLIGKMNGR